MFHMLLNLALLSPTIQAQKTDLPKPEPYFPTKIGTKRVYEWVFPKNPMEFTHEIVKVENQKDGVFLVTEAVKVKSGAIWKTQLFKVSDDIIIHLSEIIETEKEKKETKRFEMLRVPFKVGDEWSTEDISGNKVTQKIAAIDVEVTVPAGKYNCVLVEKVAKISNASRAYTSKIWYSKGVGAVKTEQNLGNYVVTIELKSVSFGK